MSDFAALQTALSGLMAHRRAMEVIGHNIANANTAGFTRRRIDLQPAGGAAAGGVWARSTSTGDGVNVNGVTRMREDFLDLRVRRELSTNGTTDQVSNILNRIEQTMPEPSDTGLAAKLSAFWGSWDDAAARPDDLSVRSAVLQQADSLAGTFHTTAQQLLDLRDQLGSDTQIVVEQVNADSARVADLNNSIVAAKAAGVEAGDLEDQRDLIIDRIVSSTGATTRGHDDGSVDVFLGGSTLVRGNHAEAISVVTGPNLDPPLNALGLTKTELRWATDGYPVVQLAGHLGGNLQGINTLVPQYLNQLNGVAATLVSKVNALHQTGHGLGAGDVNLSFFDPVGVTAATLSLSSAVVGQPSRIALAAGAGGALDGSLGHQIAAVVDSQNGPDALHRTLIGQLGIDVQSAQRRADVQSKITKQVDSDRQSVQGVSIDEEMTSLVATQRAYEASARVMTAVDQLLETLITRTGMAGR